MTNPPLPDPAAPARAELSPTVRFIIDFGPLLIFFAVNSLAPGDDIDQAVWATGAFMIAIVITMAYSFWKTRRVTPIQIVTGVIVAVFGGLTIYLHDETFIQLKPTIVYALFAGILLTGLLTGKPLLKMVLESGFPDMTERGWNLMTRNWALFFLALAILNEIVRHQFTFDQWVQFKVWGVTALSFIMALAQAPILMKHSEGGEAEN
ncbi:septation protein A [Pacificimonas sp. WHA3]|uniref:Inner membrane-spanning protein YciB n=1 Tax=Pacificimonas pallii TaxID=2827236 RepID=A0ABS6SGR8_9SPHN|nr:septation protein A [Pacificimonas pallii]MBV7257615.1 septation protein A [Pacificimonas pallii]